MPAGNVPLNFIARSAADGLGKPQLLLSVPECRLPRAAQLAKLAKDAAQGFLDLPISDHFHPMIVRLDETHHGLPQDVTPSNFLFKRGPSPLSK